MKKILVIEDQASMRKNIAFILEMEGFSVHTAANGKEGLDAARRERPDLILCDVMMPQMDGHEVIAALRQDPGFLFTPFIFLTAKGDREDVRCGMNLGADDYLSKPIVHEELMTAVRARLDRHRMLRDQFDARPAVSPDFTRLEVFQLDFGLTHREAEVLAWIAQGKANQDIGVLLGMTERTVKHHASQCFQKMGCENRSSATLMAIEALMRERGDPPP
jgi:DNA-binding NarL/FixJ family response regulator